MLATPCSSWSSARHGPRDYSGPPPALRNRTDSIMGFSDLSASDLIRVEVGNRTMQGTAQIITACIHHHVPVILENPIQSMLWDAPPIKHLLAQGAQKTTTDYCLFGAVWRKRTRFATWSFPHGLPALAKTCKSLGGKCDRTGVKHVQLTGWVRGSSRTLLAQEC